MSEPAPKVTLASIVVDSAQEFEGFEEEPAPLAVDVEDALSILHDGPHANLIHAKENEFTDAYATIRDALEAKRVEVPDDIALIIRMMLDSIDFNGNDEVRDALRIKAWLDKQEAANE